MQLRLLVKGPFCVGQNCPTVYATDRDTVVIQGERLAAKTVGLDVPDHEVLAEVPMSLIRELIASGELS